MERLEEESFRMKNVSPDLVPPSRLTTCLQAWVSPSPGAPQASGKSLLGGGGWAFPGASSQFSRPGASPVLASFLDCDETPEVIGLQAGKPYSGSQLSWSPGLVALALW